MHLFSPTPLIDRRRFLAGFGAGVAGLLAPGAARALERSDALFASAYMTRDGYGVAMLTERGEILHRTPLPDRGHDVVMAPDGSSAIAFARRPGTFAVKFDPAGRTPPLTISSPEGRHFYGHGAFSLGGRLVYATENDFDAARGMIGIYDVADRMTRIGEFESHGVGPHDIEIMPDGRHMVIANGAIETHPDMERVQLNLATMKPNIAVIEIATGALVARHALAPELHQLSLRHMARDGRGRVWFACQNQGDATQVHQLVGHLSADLSALRLIDLPEEPLVSLRGYVGSIECNATSGLVAITSPRGNVAISFEGDSGRIVDELRIRNVCGVAPHGAGFIRSTGEGEFAEARLDIGFDNHIAVARG
ncbi:hypothetical protein DFR52_102627 [Hoeflea marina]|uniref:DUF1513 domain-containing protein n=1 Tax=Hoeflea marina TaxID=274592 RepID=A0A317PM14_9HYPH|nr:DUF1513 domain-containing protein [Hoeflea marina]PWW01962.1 hypothetical protein DFR52_102627 [Hoeflea marina]